MLLDDALNLGLDVSGRDQKAFGYRTHVFVLFSKQGHALCARLDRALAQKLDRLGDGRCGGSYGLVDLPEDRLVLANTDLPIGSHVFAHPLSGSHAWYSGEGRVGLVVRVRFNNPDNLASCEGFFLHAFPGDIERNGNVLDLTFRRGSFGPTPERKVVERLLWAWRVSHQIDMDDGFVVVSEQPDAQATD